MRLMQMKQRLMQIVLEMNKKHQMRVIKIMMLMLKCWKSKNIIYNLQLFDICDILVQLKQMHILTQVLKIHLWQLWSLKQVNWLTDFAILPLQVQLWLKDIHIFETVPTIWSQHQDEQVHWHIFIELLQHTLNELIISLLEINLNSKAV